jgi:lysozyme
MKAELREMLKLHEGLRLKPYQCTVGRWTIGYGHNLEAHGETVPVSITLEQAERYLDQDIASAEANCRKQFPFFSTLDEVRQAVLIDMCFNLGLRGLTGFKNTLAAIALGNYSSAAVRMIDSQWAKQVKGRAKRLADMMAYGKWPNDMPKTAS